MGLNKGGGSLKLGSSAMTTAQDPKSWDDVKAGVAVLKEQRQDGTVTTKDVNIDKVAPGEVVARDLETGEPIGTFQRGESSVIMSKKPDGTLQSLHESALAQPIKTRLSDGSHVSFEPQGAATVNALNQSVEDRVASINAVASDLHDRWRETRRNPDGTYDPRIKPTTDEIWKAKHGTNEVDIANTPFEDLPEDWRKENVLAVEAVYNYIVARGGRTNITPREIEEAADVSHLDWLRRHGREQWVRDSGLDALYEDLPEEEKDKDRQIVNALVDRLGIRRISEEDFEFSRDAHVHATQALREALSLVGDSMTDEEREGLHLSYDEYQKRVDWKEHIYRTAPGVQREMAAFEHDKEGFDELGEEVATELGAQYKEAPIKSIRRIAEKASGKPEDLTHDIWDIVRGTIVVDNLDQMRDALKLIREKYNVEPGYMTDRIGLGKSVVDKVNILPSGYRDAIAMVDLGGNRMAEIQVHIPEMLKAKEEGHAFYEIERSLKNLQWSGIKLTENQQRALNIVVEMQQRLYEDAWRKFKERTGYQEPV